jgi:hypothetical protein
MVSLALLTDAQTKFTVVTKQKDALNLHQVTEGNHAAIGKPIKLHLDRVYTVPGRNLLQSQSENIHENLSQCSPTCGGGDADDDEATEAIEKSTLKMKKMLEKHERKSDEKEMLKETKEKVEKIGKEAQEEADLEEEKEDSKEKIKKMKKSEKSVKKSINN